MYEKTIEERYQELIELVPQNIRKEFERIESGEIVPQMFGDVGAKKTLDPDVHPERLSRILELIFQEDMSILGSLKGESAKASIYCKKTIVDILARLKNRGIVNAEMQARISLCFSIRLWRGKRNLRWIFLRYL